VRPGSPAGIPSSRHPSERLADRVTAWGSGRPAATVVISRDVRLACLAAWVATTSQASSVVRGVARLRSAASGSQRNNRSVSAKRPSLRRRSPEGGAVAAMGALSREGVDLLTEQLRHLLGRVPPVQGLAWTAVELGGDLVEVGLGMDREIGAFGEVLAQ
jgi:hypothetical protein